METRKDKSIPSDFLLKLLDCVLKYNIFEFSDSLYIQRIGTAMGTRAAPNVADIFMSFIDEEIIRRSSQFGELLFYRRFLDDILIIFRGSNNNLHKFIKNINTIHNSIKFTLQHTRKPSSDDCECEESTNIPFLDTSLSLSHGQVNSDLYRKPSDRNQYLLPSSCHPPHCHENIPFSLALRIIRICSNPTQRDCRLLELKEMLIARDYKKNIINSAIDKALKIPRKEAIKKVFRKTNKDRVVFSIKYDPRLPSLSKIVQKHHRTMVEEDPRLKEIFKQPPMIAYKRHRNLKDMLIRSKVPKVSNARPKRNMNGMKKCGKCTTCPYIKEGRKIKSTATNYSKDINQAVDCNSENTIYLIECNKSNCREQYVGCSDQAFKTRMSQHRGYVNNKKIEKATGYHFSQKNHSVADMKFSIIEKIYNKNRYYLLEKEKHYIRKFNTKYKGMNRNC